MMTIKVLTIGALCLVLTVGLSESKVTTKQHYYPDSYIGIDFASFENTTLSYAVCDKKENQTEKNCTVVIESRNADGSYQRDTCDLALKTENPNAVLGDALRVVPFGKKRVIVVSMENPKFVDKVDEDTYTETPTVKSLVKFNTVHFSTCKVVEAKLSMTRRRRYNKDWFIQSFLFATYTDGYDVAIDNWSSCNYQFCKVTFDSEGKKTSDPVPWFQDYESVMLYPVVPTSPIKGHVVFNYFSNKMYMVRGTDVKDLFQVDNDQARLTAFSNNYGSLRICYTVDHSIKCTKYDDQGLQKLETNSHFPYPVAFAVVQNSPSDEFFVFYMELTHSHSTQNTVYHVAKVGADGKVKKDVEIEGFECDTEKNAMMPKFSDDGNGKFCLSLLCFENEDRSFNKKDRGHFNFGFECFNYADF